MSENPQIAFRYPADVFLEAGKIYYWCTCGHSISEPFCDGSLNNLPINH